MEQREARVIAVRFQFSSTVSSYRYVLTESRNASSASLVLLRALAPRSKGNWIMHRDCEFSLAARFVRLEYDSADFLLPPDLFASLSIHI